MIRLTAKGGCVKGDRELQKLHSDMPEGFVRGEFVLNNLQLRLLGARQVEEIPLRYACGLTRCADLFPDIKKDLVRSKQRRTHFSDCRLKIVLTCIGLRLNMCRWLSRAYWLPLHMNPDGIDGRTCLDLISWERLDYDRLALFRALSISRRDSQLHELGKQPLRGFFMTPFLQSSTDTDYLLSQFDSISNTRNTRLPCRPLPRECVMCL